MVLTMSSSRTVRASKYYVVSRALIEAEQESGFFPFLETVHSYQHLKSIHTNSNRTL